MLRNSHTDDDQHFIFIYDYILMYKMLLQMKNFREKFWENYIKVQTVMDARFYISDPDDGGTAAYTT